MRPSHISRKPRSTGPFTYGWLARRFIKSISPEAKLKLKTSRGMKPNSVDDSWSDLDLEDVLKDYERITKGYVAAIHSSDGLDLGAIRVSSPFLRVFRLPMGAFFDGLGQHSIRHMEQAKRVTMNGDFPS